MGLIPGFGMFGQNLESLPPLPKDHSQSAQDSVRKPTLNPGTGGSNEKAIPRKRSAVGVGLRGAGGIRGGTGGAGICTTAPPPPAYTWTGCYVGASAGYAGGKSTHTTVGNSVLTSTSGVPTAIRAPAGSDIAGDLNLSGFIGGFQGGCNYQVGMWVIGFEGDGSATNKEGQNFETALAPFDVRRANWISQTQERWLVTARG